MIRPATEDDYSDMHQMMRRCDEKRGIGDRYKNETLEVLANRIKQPGAWAEVLEENGKIIAFYVATDRSDKEEKAHLNLLFVDPDYWYKGYGRIMFEKAASEMNDRGFLVGELFVDKDNYPARALYLSVGCWVVGDPIDIRYRFVFNTEEEVF